MRLVGVTARALVLSLVITAPLLVGCAKPEGTTGSVPNSTQGAPSTGGAASTH